jgi:hypothetical protein
MIEMLLLEQRVRRVIIFGICIGVELPVIVKEVELSIEWISPRVFSKGAFLFK